MGAAQRNRAAPELKRDRITSGENTPMGDRHLGTFVKPQCLQALGLVWRNERPVHSDDLRAAAQRQGVEGKAIRHAIAGARSQR